MTVTLDTPYVLETQVALRPERFGALAYHYGNRRLIFLRSPDLVNVVQALDEAPNVEAALERSGVTEDRWDGFLEALGNLEKAEVIHARR